MYTVQLLPVPRRSHLCKTIVPSNPESLLDRPSSNQKIFVLFSAFKNSKMQSTNKHVLKK